MEKPTLKNLCNLQNFYDCQFFKTLATDNERKETENFLITKKKNIPLKLFEFREQVKIDFFVLKLTQFQTAVSLFSAWKFEN